MRLYALRLLPLLPLAGCAANTDALRALEQRQEEQKQLLAEQNSLIEEQNALVAQSAASLERVVEMLADLDRTLRETQQAVALQREQREANAAAPQETSAPPRKLPDEGKIVLGRNEWAWLELLGRNVKARVDTGAMSSSINAVDVQPFERDGRDWVRFRVPDEEHPDGGETYETPLLRHVRIRQASVDELDRRPVVRLTVRVGKLVDETEFTLSDREDMLYPMLLGRNFLRDVAVVDVARKFLHERYRPQNAQASE